MFDNASFPGSSDKTDTRTEEHSDLTGSKVWSSPPFSHSKDRKQGMTKLVISGPSPITIHWDLHF